jgi:dihydrofolate reductase
VEKMIISLIAAVGKNRVIGKKNALIWELPPDLQHFKEITMNHHILMGRNTFETLPSEMPGRKLLVVSKNFAKPQKDNLWWFETIQKAIDFAKNRGEAELFIIGGGSIFTETIIRADKIYLTVIEAVADGDVFFPEIDFRKWQLKKTSVKQEYNGITFSYKEYFRKTLRKTKTHEDG